jgi:hypothetical protein
VFEYSHFDRELSAVKRIPSLAEFGRVQRREYLQVIGGTAIGTALAGCTDTASSSTGTLATRVSDQPQDIGDFERLVVTIFEIRIFPREEADENDETETEDETDETETPDEEATDAGADGDDEESTEPIVIEVDDVEADLVELQGENSQLVEDAELETGAYSHLQLRVRDEVDAALEDGGEAEVMTPGNAPLTFNQHFEIREDQRTTFTADFAPVRQGRTARYVLRPVPSEITVEYESESDSDSDE